MVDHASILSDFSQRLYDSDDIDTLFSTLEWAVKQLGFEHVSYSYIPDMLNRLLGNLSPVFKLSNQYPIDFIDEYEACRFGQHDFTIKKITEGEQAPLPWWQMAGQLNRKEKHIIEVARHDYGLRQGITIPVYSDGRTIAGVSIKSSESDRLFDLLYDEHIEKLTLISRMFSDRILQSPRNRSIFYKPFINSMSTTEQAVLTLLAEGHHLKTIATQLQLDYKYISNTVMASLRKKFGNVTRDQLMYLAGRMEFADLMEIALPD